ncbi:uncharacterized protein gpa33b [Alosa pseudoharengus]|uniref:uncharacterized protein gpa33b n=1 Tax=Alosa pseudoharengus TaxID=34774 RepID=UPI003F8B2A44
MTCIFRTKIPNSPTVIISWTADADDPTEPQISIGTFYHPGNQLDINTEYEGRVTMTNDVAAGISSLSFSHVTMQENRVFQCAVKIPKDNDGQPAAATRLVVLVAPSVPVCNVQGTAEYGHNINLTCKSAEGSPPPTYKWERFDTRSIPQPFPPRTTESNGVLSLFNVSRETSGYYKCTSTNKIRSVSYNMTLSVMPPSMNIGSTAGIIGGCAAGLVVLLIVVYCCCCRKKKNAPDHEMGDAVEFHDKPPLETENESDGIRYEESREDTIKQRTGYLVEDRSDRFDNHNSDTDGRQGGNRYDDRYEGSHSRSRDRLDRQEDSRSRSSDRLDRYDDTRSRSSDRLDRYDDGRSRSSDRLDRYDDGRSRSNDRLDRYDDSRSRSKEHLDRYDDSRSRSNDRLDRYEGRRDHYDDRSGRYEDRRDYSDRYEDNHTRYDDRRNYEDN